MVSADESDKLEKVSSCGCGATDMDGFAPVQLRSATESTGNGFPVADAYCSEPEPCSRSLATVT